MIPKATAQEEGKSPFVSHALKNLDAGQRVTAHEKQAEPLPLSESQSYRLLASSWLQPPQGPTLAKPYLQTEIEPCLLCVETPVISRNIGLQAPHYKQSPFPVIRNSPDPILLFLYESLK